MPPSNSSVISGGPDLIPVALEESDHRHTSVNAAKASQEEAEILAISRCVANGERLARISVPDMHCGGCIARIEGATGALTGVAGARVNLSTKRLTVRWKQTASPPHILSALTDLGYRGFADDHDVRDADEVFPSLVKALAVAGFASGNVMLLSISIWAGIEDTTRDVFHWLSAAIALPAICYSGQIFFTSAWNALRHGRANMDVPISVGVILACGLSLHDAIQGREHAYFDAAIMLLFFLLIGRTLDHMMRGKARAAVSGLARLLPRTALVIQADGGLSRVNMSDIHPDTILVVRPGERVPTDGVVIDGDSWMDYALVTGESTPKRVRVGSEVLSGTLNTAAEVKVRATATVENSFLSSMTDLMENAAGTRADHISLSARVAEYYTPFVHVCALFGFLGWFVWDGNIHQAITIAVAVLIITCPCALGLAAPIIQVVAARRLFEDGILMRDGASLERLAEVDMVVFDKTGTLTKGEPTLLDPSSHAPETLSLAGAVASHSRHPLARALSGAASGAGLLAPEVRNIQDIPGDGVEAWIGEDCYRLGRWNWACVPKNHEESIPLSSKLSITFARNGKYLDVFQFEDGLRSGAKETIEMLELAGIHVEIVSGDARGNVEAVAGSLGVKEFLGDARPADKVTHLAAHASGGRKTLFVGDGLNDGPALRAAHVSMAPSSATDLGRNAADFVFLRDDIRAVFHGVKLARLAVRMTRQNLAFAILYNIVALPMAALGFVTPLIAAISMSISSIVVVLNGFRLTSAADVARKPNGSLMRAHLMGRHRDE